MLSFSLELEGRFKESEHRRSDDEIDKECGTRKSGINRQRRRGQQAESWEERVLSGVGGRGRRLGWNTDAPDLRAMIG